MPLAGLGSPSGWKVERFVPSDRPFGGGGKNHPVERARARSRLQNLRLIFPMTNGPLWMSIRFSLRSRYLSASK